MLEISVLVSATQIIGSRTPMKSLNSELLLSGLSIMAQSGKCDVFLKHLKKIIARQNTCNLENKKLNNASSLTCLCVHSARILSAFCFIT